MKTIILVESDFSRSALWLTLLEHFNLPKWAESIELKVESAQALTYETECGILGKVRMPF